jgi:hypothetical protein
MDLTTNQKYAIGGVIVVGLIGFAWWYGKKSSAVAALGPAPAGGPGLPSAGPGMVPVAYHPPPGMGVMPPVPVAAPPAPVSPPSGAPPSGAPLTPGTATPLGSWGTNPSTLPTATATAVTAGTPIQIAPDGAAAPLWVMPVTVAFSDGTSETGGYVAFTRFGYIDAAPPSGTPLTAMKSYLYTFIGQTRNAIAPNQDAPYASGTAASAPATMASLATAASSPTATAVYPDVPYQDPTLGWAMPMVVQFSDGSSEKGHVLYSRLGYTSTVMPTDATTQAAMKSYLSSFIGLTKDQIAPMQDGP